MSARPTFKSLLFYTASLLCLAIAYPAMATEEKAGHGYGPGVDYKHCSLYNLSDEKCNQGADSTKKVIGDDHRDIETTKENKEAGKLPTWSARAGKENAAVAIDLKRKCRWVDPSSENIAREEIFVPFHSQEEWDAFVNVAPAKFVTLKRCARPSTVTIPSNDPANPQSDSAYRCYNSDRSLSTAIAHYSVADYGREGEERNISPVAMTFNCYTPDGKRPWTKTVVVAKLRGYNADRAGGSTENSANSDWGAISVSYGAPPRINGSCGSANGRSLSSAPSGGELCSIGMPSGVGGTWSWSCSGYFGGATANCSASRATPSCPVIDAWGNPVGAGYIDFDFKSVTWGRAYSDGGNTRSFYGGTCHRWNYADGQDGMNPFVSCIATQYLRRSVDGYSGVGNCTVSGGWYLSPIKVSLTGGHAVMNTKTPTPFYLTLKDGRILEGHGEGGLNPNEGWLMVHRTSDPLVFSNGFLNGDNWFGDRDGRTKNGYTDLAETFKDFLQKDEYGSRYIPLQPLTPEAKAANPDILSEGKGVTNPSFDLRVLDAKYTEHFASDFFSRIYVDYRDVVEGDGKKGEINKNAILARAVVTNHSGENYASVDQWFVLDVKNDLKPSDKPSKSKVHKERPVR